MSWALNVRIKKNIQVNDFVVCFYVFAPPKRNFLKKWRKTKCWGFPGILYCRYEYLGQTTRGCLFCYVDLMSSINDVSVVYHIALQMLLMHNRQQMIVLKNNFLKVLFPFYSWQNESSNSVSLWWYSRGNLIKFNSTTLPNSDLIVRGFFSKS